MVVPEQGFCRAPGSSVPRLGRREPPRQPLGLRALRHIIAGILGVLTDPGPSTQADARRPAESELGSSEARQSEVDANKAPTNASEFKANWAARGNPMRALATFVSKVYKGVTSPPPKCDTAAKNRIRYRLLRITLLGAVIAAGKVKPWPLKGYVQVLHGWHVKAGSRLQRSSNG